MTEAQNLVKSKRPSLPVSIPIQVYHNSLKEKRKQIFSNQAINLSKKNIPTEQNMEKQPETMQASGAEVTDKQTNEHASETRPDETTASINLLKEWLCLQLSKVPLPSDFVRNGLMIELFKSCVGTQKVICLEKSTQTDNLITLDDIETSRAPSGHIMKEVASFGRQFKHFFNQMYSLCRNLFREKTVDNRQVLVYSRRKRQLFLEIVKALINIMTPDDMDLVQLNVDVINVDEDETTDGPVNEPQINLDNVITSNPREALRQDDQRQEEPLNSGRTAQKDNAGVTPREDIGATEQTVKNTIIQKDMNGQVPRNLRIMEDTVRQNIPINTEMNIDQNTFVPQFVENNSRRFCSTPRSQALQLQQQQQQPQFFHSQNYRNYNNNKIFRFPGRGNGRPAPYSQQRMPMRNTERPQTIISTQSSEIYNYPCNQSNLQQQQHQQQQQQQQHQQQQQQQQQSMMHQYYQRNPDNRHNNYPTQY